jgi:peptidoglycan DL-endopeptidase CwlO
MSAKRGSLRGAAFLLGLAVAIVVAVQPAFGDPIGEKQAEAQRVLVRIDALGRRLDKASEAYDGATYRLGEIRASLRRNEHELRVARHDLRVAIDRLDALVRGIYMEGRGDATIDVLLGARSLTDVVDGLDAQNRVAQQDGELVSTVRHFRTKLAHVRDRLQRTRRAQERLVKLRAEEKARIEGSLREQRRLLSSIRSQIAELRHEEAVRQAQLAAAAAARLALERAQQQQALDALVVGATSEAPGAAGPVTVVPPSRIGTSAVAIAERYLGYPYVWGAAGPTSFDCSGLVTYVFAQIGISLPHFAAAQWNYGTYVSEDQLEPGDLVFFANLDHVGIYVGGGEYIQAPHPGDVVRITPLSEPWSAANYFGAKRIS